MVYQEGGPPGLGLSIDAIGTLDGKAAPGGSML